MDDFTWFVVGVAAGAVGLLGAGYAVYKAWVWRNL
jgi:hypothetical protein